MKLKLLLFLPLLLLSSCPKPPAAGRQAAEQPPASAAEASPPAIPQPLEAPEPPPALPDSQVAAPEIYATTDAAQLVRDFGRFLNEQDRERYSACIHEASPRRDALLWNYDDFQSGHKRVSIDDIVVTDCGPGRALASYSLTLSHSDSGEVETEQGEFELVQLQDGHWVIWTIH